MVRQRCFLVGGGVWLGIGVLLLWPKTACAVVLAFDNANPTDPAYADGWNLGDNGGFGFGPWGGSFTNALVHEIDTDAPEPDNNLGTPAFRLGAEYYTADRPFASPMAAGQTFKMDLDKYAFDPADAPEGAYIEQDSLIRLNSAGGERFALYDWLGSYTFGGQTTTYNADEWGIGADSAFDNLNGGAPLPESGGLFKPGYTGPDSEDGFTFILDLPTIDTYRLQILDDNVTKVDVSGALRSTSGTPPVDITGQGINSLSLWFTPGDYSAGFPSAYFTNLEISTTVVPAVPGDYNNNGKVDAGDYVLWRKGGPLANEVDTPGTVNAADYAEWRARFGNPSSGSGLGNVTIPEPASLLLIIVGCSVAAGWRRNR